MSDESEGDNKNKAKCSPVDNHPLFTGLQWVYMGLDRYQTPLRELSGPPTIVLED